MRWLGQADVGGWLGIPGGLGTWARTAGQRSEPSARSGLNMPCKASSKGELTGWMGGNLVLMIGNRFGVVI